MREPLGHFRERQTRAQQLAAHEVQTDVAITEPEPRLAAERGDRVERLPALAGPAPPTLFVGEARERVEDAVQIGRDSKPQHLEVVRDVADDRDAGRIDDPDEPAEKPRAADATRESDNLHAAAPRCSATSTRRVFGPTRGARRRRSSSVSTSSLRFGTSTRRDGPSAANRSALPGP